MKFEQGDICDIKLNDGVFYVADSFDRGIMNCSYNGDSKVSAYSNTLAKAQIPIDYINYDFNKLAERLEAIEKELEMNKRIREAEDDDIRCAIQRTKTPHIGYCRTDLKLVFNRGQGMIKKVLKIGGLMFLGAIVFGLGFFAGGIAAEVDYDDYWDD